MRKIVLSVFMLVMSISLFGCSEKVTPLENPENELFTNFYTGSNFEIYIRTEIDEEKYYQLMGFHIESDKGTYCTIGLYHLENYLVYYKEAYYDLLSGAKLNLYTGNDLIDFGIDASCRNE